MPSTELRYQSGFGNEFATEAVAGALPVGQNSPQQAPLGLYAEQLSGSPFTAPRATNRRTWTYRIRPSVTHKPYTEYAGRHCCAAARSTKYPRRPTSSAGIPFRSPRQPPISSDGLVTIAGNGDPAAQTGVAMHVYAANASMQARYLLQRRWRTADRSATGARCASPPNSACSKSRPGEICVIPRGIKFRVELPDGASRGYICENYGAPFRLPELGAIGANGLANARDFLAPVAAFEDRDGDFRIVAKFLGKLWIAEIDHSPLDVVAWHGNYAPYKYDLARFNCINTVSFDHPDPSIYTVLTSPSRTCDFAIFPPRWLVAEHTFRPPWFHRNLMNEFMGLIFGEYDAKAEGFLPGGASLHNCMSGHGPDAETYERASTAELKPQYLDDTLAFMFETQLVLRPTRYALESRILQHEYFECWQGLKKHFRP